MAIDKKANKRVFLKKNYHKEYKETDERVARNTRKVIEEEMKKDINEPLELPYLWQL